MAFDDFDTQPQSDDADAELHYMEQEWLAEQAEADREQALEDLDEWDGQPDEYTEWQDLHGGDDWDHGQYDEVPF